MLLGIFTTNLNAASQAGGLYFSRRGSHREEKVQRKQRECTREKKEKEEREQRRWENRECRASRTKRRHSYNAEAQRRVLGVQGSETGR